MNRAVAKKLQEIVDRAADLESEWNFTTWSARARAYLLTALGPDEATRFDTLISLQWPETLALRLGYLEGLAALAEGETQEGAPNPPESTKPSTHSQGLDSRKVFVVHGRDDAAKNSVALFLQRVGLDPIILHEQPSAGRTIIEKFETYSSDVAFAVVLLTPDDVGSEAGDGPRLRPRARQNVIMELGFFIGKLGRTRVCALHKGDVELPSDYQGVLYLEMDAAGGWKTKLGQELVQSRITIKLEGLLGA